MPRDKVVLKSRRIESFRRRHAMGRYKLYKQLSIHATTGKKILTGKPVSLEVARKVAQGIGVDVQNLIKSWANEAETVTS